MGKKQTRLFHPELSLDYIRIWFLRDIERHEPRVIAELHQLIERWLGGKKWRLNDEDQKRLDELLKDFETKIAGNDEIDTRKWRQSFLLRTIFELSVGHEENFNRKGLSKLGILDEVDQWLEKWNLNGKEWIYETIALTLAVWYVPVTPASFAYHNSPTNDDLKIPKPEPFVFNSWSVEMDQSAEDYIEGMTLAFQEHLKEYVQDSCETLKRKGFKERRRPVGWYEHVEWLVRWTVQEWTITDIASAYNVTDSAVRKALKTLETYDLPIRKNGKN